MARALVNVGKYLASTKCLAPATVNGAVLSAPKRNCEFIF